MEFGIDEGREYIHKCRDRLLRDPYRPGYHFAMPNGYGRVFDPNGAFYVDGRYHLMFLHENVDSTKFSWGHISSSDLLHWRHHPDALVPEDDDDGPLHWCGDGYWSGGAYVAEDESVYLTCWKLPKGDGSDDGGILLAKAKAPFDVWEAMDSYAIQAGKEFGMTPLQIDGKEMLVCCADPSNIWKDGEFYYMETGNERILNTYGVKEDSPIYYRGDWTDLFRSRDLKNWEYVHRTYVNPHTNPEWPDYTEDHMCPVFFPLFDARENGKETGKYLELFIAHNRGCQYYIGTWRDERFLPEQHGRMSWNDVAFFAPEALVDDRNRLIMWAWVKGEPKGSANAAQAHMGWAGMYSFPRQLWLENDVLHMAPVEELDMLQRHYQKIEADSLENIPVKNGESFRMKAEITVNGSGPKGFRIRANADESEYTDIYVADNRLVMDTTHSGNDGLMILEEAPFTLEADETLKLDIFVDKCVVEVYANHRQAICRRIYPSNPAEAVRIRALENTQVEKLELWEMMPSFPY